MDVMTWLKVNDVNEQLADIIQLGKYIQDKFNTNTPFSAMLIGDSIGAGNGATGYDTPNTNPIILTDTDLTVYYEANYTCKSWANYLRNSITSIGGTFFNAAIGGKSAKWFNDRKTNILTANKDVIIVALGTNDRWDCTDLNEFITKYSELLAYVKTKCTYMLVVCPPPVNTDETIGGTNHFYIKDVEKAVIQICKDNDYKYISMYKAMCDFLNKSKSNYADVLNDTTHPNDKGYAIYWKLVQEKLGIVIDEKTYTNYDSSLDSRNVLVSALNAYTATSVPSDFPAGKVVHTSLSIAGSTGFPGAGILVTDNTQSSAGYCYQILYLYNSNTFYTRKWLTNNTWSSFVKYTTSISEEVTVDLGTLTAGQYVEVNTSATVNALDTTNYTLVVSPKSYLAWVTLDFIKSDNNHVKVKAVNHSASSANVGVITLNVTLIAK